MPYTDQVCAISSYTIANPPIYGLYNPSSLPPFGPSPVLPTTTIWPVAAGTQTFLCNGNETGIQSSWQWVASDSEPGTEPGVRVASTTPTWTPSFLFGPDITLTANPSIGYAGTAVQLTWTINPQVGGSPVACSTAPAGWAPSPDGSSSSGTSVVTLSGTGSETFTLNCTDGNTGLVSTANVIVSIAVLSGGGAGGHVGGSGPGGAGGGSAGG